MESSRVIGTELFPYETFPIRLEFGEKKHSTVSYFQCDDHLQKYLERYKLDKTTIKIDYRDGEPVVRSKKHKRDVEQEPEPKSNRSSGTSKGRTTRLDSVGNTPSTPKRKK